MAAAAAPERQATEASSTTAGHWGGGRFGLRHLWLIPGLGLAFFVTFQGAGLSVNLVPLLLFAIVPEVPRAGGLHRRSALFMDDVLHQPALPIAILVGTAVTGVSPFAYTGALVWIGHLVVERTLIPRSTCGAASGARPTG